jgi:hypothetical protein
MHDYVVCLQTGVSLLEGVKYLLGYPGVGVLQESQEGAPRAP